MADDGTSERMLTLLLQSSGQPEHIIFAKRAEGHDSGDGGPSLGEGAGLIDDERGDFTQRFESLGVLEKYARLRPTAHGDHDRHGRSQTEGAWAGDDEDGDGIHHREGKGRAEGRTGARQKGHHCRQDDGGHKPSCHHVGQALDGRAAAVAPEPPW